MKNSNFILKIYSITLTFILGFLVITGFKNSNHDKFEEITVERINIVEPDGKLKMVISNSNKQHPGMFNGKNLKDRQRPPGMIFFNEEQDEVGGLIYEGNQNDGAGMILSFDQYKNDQIMQMQYQRKQDNRQQYGVNFWDRSENITLPVLVKIMDSMQKQGVHRDKILDHLKKMNDGKPIAAQRLFTGKTYNNQVGLFIKDEFGNDRINIYVDENNEPKFEILDENRNVIKNIGDLD